jgi:hypothetical protein
MRIAAVGILVALSLAGCSSSSANADPSSAEFKWLQGELKTALPHSLERVETATRAAYDELRLVGVDGTVTGTKGALTARMADGTKVRVKLQAAGAEVTIVRIKVGQIGDEAISLQLLRHISSQLP